MLHQARLPGHQPRIPLLVLGELLAQPLALVRQVAAVAEVLLHQLVPLPRQARHLGRGLLQLELVSECCSCSLSCWMGSSWCLVLLLSAVPTAIPASTLMCIVCVMCVMGLCIVVWCVMMCNVV